MDAMQIGSISVGKDSPLFLIAGPCVIESEELVLKVATFLKDASLKLGTPVIFKASFDKANRTSLQSFRGPGLERGLEILQKVKREVGLPVLGCCVGNNCRIGSGHVVYPARTIESDVVLFTQPGRRVITKNVSFEQSDHHDWPGQLHQPQYRPHQIQAALQEDAAGSRQQDKASPLPKRSTIERMINRIDRL